MNEERGFAEASAAIAGLSAGRRAALAVVARHGDVDAETVGRELVLSGSAVRQQMAALCSEGLVAYRQPPRGRGRPRNRYHLTPAGEAFFPQVSHMVLAETMRFLERAHPRVLDEAMAELYGSWSAHGGIGVPIEEIGAAFEKHGFLVRTDEEDGTLVVRIGHCPLAAAARRFPRFCAAEHEALRAAFPGAAVERPVHRLDGGSLCVYEFRVRCP
jgi:predicted ArsR family transcriptional regulator